MASNVLSPTLADYASHIHLHDRGKGAPSGYLSSLSNIVDAVSPRKDNSVQVVEPSTNEGERVENEELKLPSRSSLLVVIGGNALFQVRDLNTPQVSHSRRIEHSHLLA